MINKIRTKLKGQFLKNFLLLALATFLGKGLGFFKEMMIANYFGTSHQLDILIFSFTLAGTFLGILSGGMEATVLPNYLKSKAISVTQKNTYLFSVFSLFLLFLLIVYVVIALFGSHIINFIAPGFSLQDIKEATSYLNIFFIYILFAFLSVFFLIILKAEKKFFYSGIVPSLIPASIMVFLFFKHDSGVVVIAYAVIIGAILQLLFSWLKSVSFVSFKGVEYTKLKDNYRRIMKNYSVLLGSGLFIGLIGLTDQSFATLAGEGAVSSLSYAQKLPALIDGLVVMVLGTILFSSFAENISLSRYEDNKILYMKTLKLIFSGSILVVLILSFFSKELTNIVFVRGAFDYDSLMMVYPIQTAFFLKLPFIATSIISARMMNSFELNREMFYINMVSFGFNLILDYYLVTSFGTLGIAYATLFVYIWAAVLNHLVVMRQFKRVSV